MPSACLLALTTMTAAFQRMDAPDAALDVLVAGEPRLALGRDRVDVGVLRSAGTPTCRSRARSSSLSRRYRARVLPCAVDDGVEGVEPLLVSSGSMSGNWVGWPSLITEGRSPVLSRRPRDSSRRWFRMRRTILSPQSAGVGPVVPPLEGVRTVSFKLLRPRAD